MDTTTKSTQTNVHFCSKGHSIKYVTQTLLKDHR